mmetsp:Transcript_66323/g.145464  ORF Transcript_66323/g.145464 Transcript_66323/m.145464 type:complete len:242 (+) Transcript_66323:57-782(+)
MLSIQGLKLDGPNGGVDVSKVAQKEFVLKVLVKPPKLVYEWSAPELCFGYGRGGFSRAKVEMSTSSVSVSLSEISAQRTRLHVELSDKPTIDIGTQDWDKKQGRRARTKWIGLGDRDIGCEALPNSVRQIFLMARSHELILQHTLPKVQLELSKIQLADAPTVKRPLSEYNQLQKALAVANKKIRKEKMRGSDGARCDGCGLDADSGEDDVDVICGRCLYTACGSCEVHHCRGTCYCKKGW